MVASALSDAVSIATLIVALVAIGVSVYLWLRGREKKLLSYELTSSPVVSVRREAKDRIEIRLDGAPVHDMQLVTLRVVSTGNTEISSEDFERPLSVPFGPHARVFEPEVVRCSPGLEPTVTLLQETTLIVAPLLLKPGESFAITALVSGMQGPLRLDGRVAGVPGLAPLNADTRRRSIYRFADIGGPAVAGGVIGVGAVVTVTVAGFFAVNKHESSLVTLRQGGRLCGSVVRYEPSTALVKLTGTGRLVTVPLGSIRAIRDHAC